MKPEDIQEGKCYVIPITWTESREKVIQVRRLCECGTVEIVYSRQGGNFDLCDVNELALKIIKVHDGKDCAF